MKSFGEMKIQKYRDFYDRHLKDLAGDAVSVLELGILGGESLIMWDCFFYNPEATVTGLDMNPPVDLIGKFGEHDFSRIKQYQGFQDDPALLNQIAEERGPFDIIVDDASHQAGPTKASFEYLFPHLKSGVGLVKDLVDFASSNDWPSPVDSVFDWMEVSWGQVFLRKK